MAVNPEVFRMGYMNIYFATAVPSLAGEGPFEVGDWIILTAPTAAAAPGWVCTARGTGATATFKAMAVLAS